MCENKATVGVEISGVLGDVRTKHWQCTYPYFIQSWRGDTGDCGHAACELHEEDLRKLVW